MIKIANKPIGTNAPCFIIAEIGVNHNGNLKLAEELVDAAKSSGADAVKFQTFVSEDLAVKNAPMAEYQKKSLPGGSQFEMLRKLELSRGEFRRLFNYSRKKRIIFFSSPFDSASASFLNALGVPAFKIGSGELTNTCLLPEIAVFGRPIILSTGMADMKEVKEAVRIIFSAGNKDIALLHCTSSYPADYNEVNLKAIKTLADKLSLPVGYSDHTIGIEVAIAAVSMGACIIEKHFTLDKNLKGPDHKISSTPDEFRAMVRSIRNIEKAMGDGIKRPQKSELVIKNIVRKSIVAACDIPKGARLQKCMFAVKRPGTGIEPASIDALSGRKAIVLIRKDKILKWAYVSQTG